MKSKDNSSAAWVAALVLAAFSWFLGGVISAGTGRKRGG